MKNVAKRLFSLLLIVSLCISMFAVLFIKPTYADSNDRIKAFIKLAAGAQITDEDLSGLTWGELQFLGVYLSNFYQPFGTEFGRDDEGVLEEGIKDDMIANLQTKLAFSDTMAEQMVDIVLSMTRSTTQYLNLYAMNDDGEYVDLSSIINASYFNFFRLMFGAGDEVFEGYPVGLHIGGGHYENLHSQLRYSPDESIMDSLSLSVLTNSEGSYKSGGNIKSYEGIDTDIFYRSLNYLSYGRSVSDDFGMWTSDTDFIDYAVEGSLEQAWGITGTDYIYENIYDERDVDEFIATLDIYHQLRGIATLDFPIYGDDSGYTGIDNSYERPDGSGFQINFYVFHNNSSGGHTADPDDGFITVSKYSDSTTISAEPFISASSGTAKVQKIASASLFVNKTIWDVAETICKIKYNHCDKLYFGYEDKDEVHIVYDCSLNGEFTPSQLEFMRCLETLDISEGYGLNLLDYDSKEIDGELNKDTLEDLFRMVVSYTNKEIVVKSTIFDEKIGVDCFGNILCLGANHQYVIVPAAMNPFVWQAVDSDGNDLGDPGQFMNVINAINLVQIDNGLINKVNASGNYAGIDGATFDSDEVMHLTVDLENFVSDSISGYNGIGNMLNSVKITGKNYMGFQDNELNGIPAYIIRGSRLCALKDLESVWQQLGYGLEQLGDMLGVADVDWAMLPLLDKIIYYYRSIYPDDDSVNYVDYSGRDMEWGDDQWYYFLIEDVSDVIDNLYDYEEVNVLDGFVFIDNLGVYRNPDGSDTEYSAFNVEHYIDPHGNGDSDCSISGGINSSPFFGSYAQEILSGKTKKLESATEQALASIYVSYVYAYFYNESSKADTIGKIGYRFAKERLPSAPNNQASDLLMSIQGDIELDAIRDWTYYLLHPTAGFKYVTTLLTNKLNNLLLGWHGSMLGTNNVGINTGTTKYRSTVGYVTMPDLSELEWTDKLISFYQDCIPFLIIVIVVLMLLAFITGMLSLQRSIFAAVLFSAFLLLPTVLINGSVQQSNAISQRIYGEKFTYWAMIQQESYSSQIDEAANAEGSSGTSTYSNYLRTLYGLNQEVYSNQGSNSIILKWQAPKKMASLVLTEADGKSINGLSEAGKAMLYGMLNNSYSGQSYVNDEDAVYMYRSYIDISNFSRYIYRGIADKKVMFLSSGGSSGRLTYNMRDAFSPELLSAVGRIDTEYQEYRDAGYTNSNGLDNTAPLLEESYWYATAPLSSPIIANAVKSGLDMEHWDSTGDILDINQDIFNFGVPQFTSSNGTDMFDVEDFAATGNINPSSVRYTSLEGFMNRYSQDDITGLAAYALYSENPFYYFSWKLYHDGLGYESSLYNKNGYKDLLLGKENGGYFYMTEGNGELKDFMDLKSMFTYVIPYMKECNDIVRQFDDTYGIFIYEGVPTEEGHWGDVSGDPELEAKYWHNLNVARMYCIYCPWVDIMYDCSYADAETITVLGRRVVIEDPLNPASYPDDRPMIFSKAEMVDYGLTESDLTSAERIILQVNEDMQERMFDLLNYYNFSDITLNTAAAMECAFAFNIAFSETGLFTDNHNIYPQSFDLSNFSYDAFLRFILSESTGESLLDNSVSTGTYAGTTTGDFYERVVVNSSTTTAILLIVLDVLSVYVLPAFKIFFLVLCFISSILIVFVCLCKVEDNAKFIKKVITGFITPLLKFFIITVCFSLIISLFMGKGNNSITQTDEITISLGDPVMVILVMIVLDIICLVLYWKIIKKLLQDIRFNGANAFHFAGGVLGAAGGLAVGAVVGAASVARNGYDRAESSHRYHSTKRAIKKNGKNGDDGGDVGGGSEPAQTGTGVESSRAFRRGSASIESGRDDASHVSQEVKKPVRTQQSSHESVAEKTNAIDYKAKSGYEKLSNSDSGGQKVIKSEKAMGNGGDAKYNVTKKSAPKKASTSNKSVKPLKKSDSSSKKEPKSKDKK